MMHELIVIHRLAGREARTVGRKSLGKSFKYCKGPCSSYWGIWGCSPLDPPSFFTWAADASFLDGRVKAERKGMHVGVWPWHAWISCRCARLSGERGLHAYRQMPSGEGVLVSWIPASRVSLRVCRGYWTALKWACCQAESLLHAE